MIDKGPSRVATIEVGQIMLKATISSKFKGSGTAIRLDDDGLFSDPISVIVCHLLGNSIVTFAPHREAKRMNHKRDGLPLLPFIYWRREAGLMPSL
jgi:hypothetical protein